jgi:hypothetical protein
MSESVPPDEGEVPPSEASPVAKAQSTRGQRAGDGPSGGDLDQLLDDPPRGDHHLGHFAGYRAGRGPRRAIALTLVSCALIAVVAFVRHQGEIEERAAKREYERLHPWKLPEGSDASSRSRDFHWSSGSMRIALSREAPGIERIILPDKVITLADGTDSAQIKVEVDNGHTLGIKILSGDVVHRERLPDESF